MHKHFRTALVLLVSMVVLHFIAVGVGLYAVSIVWIDKVLHILAGAAVALLALWVLERRSIRATALRVILIVFVLAVLWELLEFLFMALFPTYARSLAIYSPNLLEATSDVITNLIGALAVFLLRNPRSKRHLTQRLARVILLPLLLAHEIIK